jgi:NAD+ synthase
MQTLQQEIIRKLGVQPAIDSAAEIEKRVQFLTDYVKTSGKKGLVLSISGGQDSTLAGRLCQLAAERLRLESDQPYTYIAVRLPYGVQLDEDDAQAALSFINPDRVVTINIKEAVDRSMQAFQAGTGEALSDYWKGNTKARERMKVHYDLAGHYDLLVVGTDHAAEALTGFYTKFGDGGCDVTPLAGLNKRQGKQLLEHLGAPHSLIYKVPTADLLDHNPGRTDEDELGFSYDEIDDYLEGKPVSDNAREKIETRYLRSEHKRRMPVTPDETWWNNGSRG